MYCLKPGIKQDPVKRWNLPDRIFFGYGACHILAGVFLQKFPNSSFWPEKIQPRNNHSGNHVFVTNGNIAFDFHGYSSREALLKHHERGWKRHYADWKADIIEVDFDLLNTANLNSRKMKGPDQYLRDPIPRAVKFINKYQHTYS